LKRLRDLKKRGQATFFKNSLSPFTPHGGGGRPHRAVEQKPQRRHPQRHGPLPSLSLGVRRGDAGGAIGIDPNVPGLLLTLSGRNIIPPQDRDLWPAQDYLHERRQAWKL